MSRKQAALQKKVLYEKTLNYNNTKQASKPPIVYKNPAKLMNHIKAKKAQENRTFRNSNEYLSHIDAY